MEWTDIRLTVAKADADNAEAVATMIAEGGIYIEDYSDIEQQVAEIAHVDLIEQELLDKPRDQVIIHMYLEPGASPVETLALISARMEAAGIAYTVETEGVEQEDWQNGWRKYYHPMEIGQRLAVVPSWQEYDTDRVKLILDPGLAFGTGGHETTSLCLEALDERVKGGERVLDIGTGSGVFGPGKLLDAVEGGQIVPLALHGPNFIPPGAEGLLGVALHADVDKEGLAVLVDRDAAGVVVVVAVAVGPHLRTQHPAALPRSIDAHARIPHRAVFGLFQGAGPEFLFRKGGDEPIPQIDAAAAVLIGQAVGVVIGPEILRRQRTEGVAAHSLTEAVFPRAAPPCQRAAVAEVEVIRAVHMDIEDVFRDVSDLWFLEQRPERLRGCC